MANKNVTTLHNIQISPLSLLSFTHMTQYCSDAYIQVFMLSEADGGRFYIDIQIHSAPADDMKTSSRNVLYRMTLATRVNGYSTTLYKSHESLIFYKIDQIG